MTDAPLILHFFAVTGIGGSELGALSYMRAQPEFRHRLLYLFPRGPANALYEEAGYETDCLDLGRRTWWGVRGALDRHLRRIRPDLVHAYGLRPSLLLRFASPRPPIIQSVHSLDEHRPSWQAWADRWTARRVDLVIANSQAGARFLAAERGMPADRIHVVENGIDLNRFLTGPDARQAARAALGLTGEEAIILTVANLRAPKGLDILVETATALGRRGRRFVWLLAGTGPDEAWLQRALAAAGIGDRVRLLGFRRDIPSLLAAADLFCLTSRREGVPVSIVEAMAAGRPVVATDVGGVRELVLDGETGLLVRAGDAAAMQAAVERMLDDAELRATCGAAGARRAHQRYGTERAAGEIAALYRRLRGHAASRTTG